VHLLALMNKQTAVNVFLPLPGGEQATYTNSTVRFRHYDWQGSARLESNMAEHEYGDLAYAPFGESYAILNTPYPSFTGQQQDTVSGLYDFLYREYSASEGRWISPDPAGFGAADPSNPQSWNRYAYVLNNPLSNIDPNGFDCVYLNNAGTDVDRDQNGNAAGIDTNSDSGECGNNGGYWVDGTVSHVTLYTNSNDVALEGTMTDQNGFQTTTDAYHTTVTTYNQLFFVGLGYPQQVGQTVDVIKLVDMARRGGPLGSIGPTPFWDKASDCGAGATGRLAKDLTGFSAIGDIVDAASIPSMQPLLDPGNALDLAEKTGEAGSFLLGGTAGKVMGAIGDVAGKAGIGLSVATAGLSFGSCMGW